MNEIQGRIPESRLQLISFKPKVKFLLNPNRLPFPKNGWHTNGEVHSEQREMVPGDIEPGRRFARSVLWKQYGPCQR